MEPRSELKIALHAPNLVNVCIDKDDNGELGGRIYHCYDKNPWLFSNVIRMVELMEDLFDRISFPQASTKTRTFTNTVHQGKEKLEKVSTPQEAISQRGEKGTFLIYVKYRQNSSWQGEVQWLENGGVSQFVSVLELLKLLSNALE